MVKRYNKITRTEEEGFNFLFVSFAYTYKELGQDNYDKNSRTLVIVNCKDDEKALGRCAFSG